MTIYSFIDADLSDAGGPSEGTLLDGVIQEIDLQTGLVLFEWHSLDHIALEESVEPLPEEEGAAWDYVHLNSVGPDHDGDLLISGRHSSTVYKVDRETGSIIWRLGGERSDFELGPDAEFALQHDARRRDDGAITLFDNAEGPPGRESSRAIALELDHEAGTARLVEEIEHPDGVFSESQANAQNMGNGHTFIGWGSEPFFTEYGPRGSLLLSGRIAAGNDNYRAYRMKWTGRPSTRPAAMAERRGGEVVVTASWNGATEVARWQVVAGDSRDSLRPAGSANERGFETNVTAQREARFYAMRALDERGAVLGTSEVIPAP